MSSSRECLFLEIEPNQWWYVVEDVYASDEGGDWREQASAYGPFDTIDQGIDHLNAHHSNPGGWIEIPFSEGQSPPDAVMIRLMEEAKNRDRNAVGMGYLSFRGR